MANERSERADKKLHAKDAQEPKKKTRAKSKVAFPVKAFVNPWGFIHLSKEVIEAFGVNISKDEKKSAPITIDMNEGSLIIRKSG